jgi:hypothetical protein
LEAPTVFAALLLALPLAVVVEGVAYRAFGDRHLWRPCP